MVNLLTGAWAVAAAWGFGPMYVCPNGGCPVSMLASVVPVIGIVLILDALACYIGLRTAFMVGGVLSALVAAITLLEWAGQSGGEVWAALVVLSLAAVILDILASRRGGQLKEQANPMNLPVFG